MNAQIICNLLMWVMHSANIQPCSYSPALPDTSAYPGVIWWILPRFWLFAVNELSFTVIPRGYDVTNLMETVCLTAEYLLYMK